MKNNIKKASVKVWEELLYFQHFMQIFVFASDYHHLNKYPSTVSPVTFSDTFSDFSSVI